jgi:hypothetical protein
MTLSAARLAEMRTNAERAVGYKVALPATELLALLDERDSMRAAEIRREYDLIDVLAEALGYELDEDGSYRIGNLTAGELAAELRDRCVQERTTTPGDAGA